MRYTDFKYIESKGTEVTVKANSNSCKCEWLREAEGK